MTRDIIVAEGLFSKLTISLSEDTVAKLAVIKKKDNPLAAVETDLKKVLDDFERRYFEITHPLPEADTQVSDLESLDSADSPDVTNPQ